MDNEEGWSVVANKRPQSAEKPKSKGARGGAGRGSGQKGRNSGPFKPSSSTPTKSKGSPRNDKTEKSMPSLLHEKTADESSSKEFETPRKEEKGSDQDMLTQSLDALKLTDDQPVAVSTPAPKAWSAGSKLTLKADDAPEVRKVLAPGASAMEDAQVFRQRAQQYLRSPSIADQRLAQRPDVVRGLINNNNACFRNVVIQALLSLPPFVSMLDYLSEHLLAHRSLSLLPLWSELLAFHLVHSQPTPAPPPGPSASGPALLLLPRSCSLTVETHLPLLCASFPGAAGSNGGATSWSWGKSKAAQQDAMEFLTHVLDSLHEEIQSKEDG
eukprot:gene41835-51071_t